MMCLSCTSSSKPLVVFVDAQAAQCIDWPSVSLQEVQGLQIKLLLAQPVQQVLSAMLSQHQQPLHGLLQNLLSARSLKIRRLLNFATNTCDQAWWQNFQCRRQLT